MTPRISALTIAPATRLTPMSVWQFGQRYGVNNTADTGTVFCEQLGQSRCKGCLSVRVGGSTETANADRVTNLFEVRYGNFAGPLSAAAKRGLDNTGVGEQPLVFISGRLDMVVDELEQ